MTSNRAERLNGVRETRAVALQDFEWRSGANADTVDFKGYASLFNKPYEMYGGPDKGGWMEIVDSKAFDRTLSAKPDVVLNINHGEGGTGLPLARTTSGTLDLRTDNKGLLPSATLDLRDPDVRALDIKAGRGDINQMSFAFRTIRQEWKDADGNLVSPDMGVERRLLELSLDRGDVSIVTNGANPKTSFQLRGLDEIAAALAAMDFDEAAEEVRSLDPTRMSDLRAAHSLLGKLTHYAVGTEHRFGNSDPVIGCAQAIDAALDAAEDAFGAGQNDQGMALLEAVDLSVDALLKLLGATDADGEDDGSYSSVSYKAAYGEYGERAYSEADRKKMASSGEAMPDGSYPIANLVDLHNAIHAVGRGSADHNAIRRHIMARAKALNASDVIPPDWNSDGSTSTSGQNHSASSHLSLAQAKRLAQMDAR